MSADLVLAVVLLIAGVIVLVAAWAIHWLMLVIGLALLVLAAYIAVGGTIAGL